LFRGEKQVIESFAVTDECYRQLDTQTLRSLRLVSRFVSKQATKVLFRELNLTGRSIEEVSEIFTAFGKEPLKYVPQKITHHFYNMVPWQVMADGEISDLYIHDLDKLSLPVFCRDWIEPYFNIVNKLYNSIGSQLQTLEFQGPSAMSTAYGGDGIDSSKFRTKLREGNSWSILIHFTCLGALQYPHIKINHLLLRSMPIWEIIRNEPRKNRLGFYDECPKLKKMVEKQDDAGFWPVTDIRRLSLLITGFGKTCL